MEDGRLNIIAGCIIIFIGGIGGFFLGFSLPQFFENGFYELPLVRLLIKAGHTHGMPFAFYNLIVAALITRLTLSAKAKKVLSIATVVTIFMPIGLILRGLDGGALTFAPVVMVGAIAFFTANGLMLKGALKK